MPVLPDFSDRLEIGDTVGIIKGHVQLPSHLTCEQCIFQVRLLSGLFFPAFLTRDYVQYFDSFLFQWTYTAGNNWGVCDGEPYGRLGCGPQETFRACSDVSILADEEPTFDESESASTDEVYESATDEDESPVELPAFSYGDLDTNALDCHSNTCETYISAAPESDIAQWCRDNCIY